MDREMARLCLDCEEIFEGNSRCPKCGSEAWYPIMGWIRPTSEAQEPSSFFWRQVVRRSCSDHSHEYFLASSSVEYSLFRQTAIPQQDFHRIGTRAYGERKYDYKCSGPLKCWLESLREAPTVSDNGFF
jgi:hypothetical protein